LTFIHFKNYKQTIENVQHIVDSIIYQELGREKIENQDPVNILWSRHKKTKVKK